MQLVEGDYFFEAKPIKDVALNIYNVADDNDTFAVVVINELALLSKFTERVPLKAPLHPLLCSRIEYASYSLFHKLQKVYNQPSSSSVIGP